MKEKINNYVKMEEANNKLLKQIKSFSKQMESDENEREVYVQRLRIMQNEENKFKYIIKDLTKEVDLKSSKINHLNENNFELSSKNAILSDNINNLQFNFTNSLKLLNEMFDKYVKIHEFSFKLEPVLNEAFEVFEYSLAEYKLLRSCYKEFEITLKYEVNKKENIIQTLNDKIENYKQEIKKNETPSSNLLETNVFTDKNIKDFINLVNSIKVKTLPQQKLLLSQCKEFMLEKINEIENVLNISKCSFTMNIEAMTESFKKDINEKHTTIIGLEKEVLSLKEKYKEKDALCNEMENELQHLRDNFGVY